MSDPDEHPDDAIADAYDAIGKNEYVHPSVVLRLLVHIRIMRQNYGVMACELTRVLDIADVAQHHRDWNE